MFSMLFGDLQFVMRALVDGDVVKYVGKSKQLFGYFESGEKVTCISLGGNVVVKDVISDPISESVTVQFEKRQDLKFNLPRADLKLVQRRYLPPGTRVQYRGNGVLLKKFFQLEDVSSFDEFFHELTRRINFKI